MATNYAHIALPERPIGAEELELIEALNRARMLANALEHHAAQSRTYGEVSHALHRALQVTHVGTPLDPGHAAWMRASMWASAVIDETIDNGENIAYSIDVVATCRTFNTDDMAMIIETGRIVWIVEHDSLDVVMVAGPDGKPWPVASSDLVRCACAAHYLERHSEHTEGCALKR